MPDDYQVIGWLFTARDEATDVASRAQDSLETIVGNVTSGLQRVPDVMQAVTGAAVSIAESEWAAKVGNALLRPLEIVEDSFASVFGGAFSAVMETLTETQYTLRDVASVPLKMMGGLRDLAKGGVKLVTGAVKTLGLISASAGVQMGKMVRSLDAISNLTKVFGKDGLIGKLLGPLAPLLRLLKPVIDMLVEGLLPAVETFTAIVKTAFAPLFEVAELMAQAIAPLVAELLTPIVEMAEVLAVHLGGFVANLIKTARPAGTITSLFQSLGPVIMDIFRALGGLAAEIIPIVMDTFSELAPIAVEVVKIIGKFAADLLPELGEVAKKALPPLAKAFVALLKALLPLLPPMTKLAVVLIDKVFGPAVIAGAEWFAKWVDESLVPFIDDWMPAVVIVLGDVAKQVEDFFGNFPKYANQFHILFIKPLMEWVGDLWDTITDFFAKLPETVAGIFEWIGKQGQLLLESIGLSEMGKSVRGFFTGIASAITSPVEAIKNALNKYVIDMFNTLISADLPLIGPLKEVEVLQELGLAELPHLAAGGIATPRPGGREVVVAEGGEPEAVVPLTPDSVRAFVEPVIANADITLPGIEEGLGLLRDIRDALQGTLAVGAGGVGGDDEFRHLDRAVGITGVIG